MSLNNEKDFLDVLRVLNKDNVNDLDEVRDKFFDSLMVCDEDCPLYLEDLSNSYSSEFAKQFEGNLAKDFLLSNVFGTQIKNQLTDNVIEDRGSCLYIDDKSAASAVTYVGSIKGMKKLVSESSVHFDFFKQQLLMGLIIRYSNNVASGREKDESRLNKLIQIYAEHIRGMNVDGDIPMILDDIYLLRLKDSRNSGSLSGDEYLKLVNDLIDRIYPIKRDLNSIFDNYKYGGK